MEGWVFWIIAACALALGEAFTLSFFMAPFAVGALAAAAVDALGGSPTIAWAIFVAISLATLAVVRPIARSHRRMPPQIRTGTDALVGRTALVLEETTGDAGTVKIDGEVWTARSYDDDEVMQPGQKVHVMQIRGATALVSE
jgi:membrane protein implicated in regulation of membrane protease activity